MMDPYKLSHPEDLLEAYALGTLEESEAAELETHLDTCLRCRFSVARLERVTASLGRSIDQLTPHASVLDQLMDAIPDTSPVPMFQQEQTMRPPRATYLKRTLAPVAIVLFVGLIAANLIATFLLNDQLDEIQEQNATESRLQKLTGHEAQVLQSLNELREFASYWLMDSPSLPLVLEPPGSQGNSEGILLVDEDGRHAVLMVAGMRELPEPFSYHVMLTRNDQQPTWVGQVKVDSAGRGNVALHIPHEPIFAFDSVMLTTDAKEGRVSGEDSMVLEGQIIARNFGK